MKFVFYSSGGDGNLNARTGHSVEVLRELANDEPDSETGREFTVRFEDGYEADVFASELRLDRLTSEQPSMRVETPLGAIIARASDDPDHPGIWVDLRRPDADQDLNLALVEFTQDESDLPEGQPNIITRVWANGQSSEYTDRHIHQGIEEFFEIAEEPAPVKAYTVYLSQLQYGNVIVEATSKKEAEEKARALYKQGGVEWHDEELTDLEASEEPARKPLEEGYRKETVAEPLILEPEDWTRREWATLCKLCGLPADRAERIVLHVGEMESYIGKGARK